MGPNAGRRHDLHAAGIVAVRPRCLSQFASTAHRLTTTMGPNAGRRHDLHATGIVAVRPEGEEAPPKNRRAPPMPPGSPVMRCPMGPPSSGARGPLECRAVGPPASRCPPVPPGSPAMRCPWSPGPKRVPQRPLVPWVPHRPGRRWCPWSPPSLAEMACPGQLR